VQRYKKAVAGALLGGVAAAGTALAAGLDYKQIILAFVAGALGVGGGVAASPRNAPKASLGESPPRH
jgi:hypothetical protein